jgi:hypothetical protein
MFSSLKTALHATSALTPWNSSFYAKGYFMEQTNKGTLILRLPEKFSYADWPCLSASSFRASS